MLAAHFPRTYGDKVEHQHSGIIGVMRVGRDGKMRPQTPRKLEDQSTELVVSADGGHVEPSQMKIGLVVGEPLGGEELERLYGGQQLRSRSNLKKMKKTARDARHGSVNPQATRPPRRPK